MQAQYQQLSDRNTALELAMSLDSIQSVVSPTNTALLYGLLYVCLSGCAQATDQRELPCQWSI